MFRVHLARRIYLTVGDTLCVCVGWYLYCSTSDYINIIIARD